MTATPSIERDERTVAVENTSFRWAYLVQTYGLLLLVAYRGLVRRESAWDLLALVLVGGGVAAGYQLSRQVVSGRRWSLVALVGAIIAALLAALLVMLRH
jgi:hypothetical protein